MPNFTFQIKGGGKIDIEAKDLKTAKASIKAKKLDAELIHPKPEAKKEEE